MVRAKLWFRCAAMHDPVAPIIVRPAVLGWEAKEREVSLTIERPFTGDELVMRMKGWVTADVKTVIDTVKEYGYLKVLDDRDLVVETETNADYDRLSLAISERFGDQLNLDRL